MLKVDYPFKQKILACGAEQQAGFCLTKNNCGFIINDLGSLDIHDVFEHYQSEIVRIQEETKIRPKLIAHDLSAEYLSTKFAQSLCQKENGLRMLALQHHHAHLASCIAENSAEDKIIGVVFDGSEFGLDSNFWGGDFFVGDLHAFRRTAHLSYTPFLSSKDLKLDARQQAFCYLYQAFGDAFVDLDIDFMKKAEQNDFKSPQQDMGNRLFSSSATRFFDAICALVGLREKIDYEGQGVAELERIINRSSHVANKVYDFNIKHENDLFTVCLEPIIIHIVDDLRKNISKSIISAGLHNTAIEMVRQVCQRIKKQEKIKVVALTGLAFQNKVLLNRLSEILETDGFKVVTQHRFPYNDSGISFGQAVLANKSN